MATNPLTVPGAAGAVVAWDPNSGAALPAYLADALDELGSNVPDRNTVPSLSYEGKTWQIVKDGNKTKLQAKNGDGDMVPVPVMRVVILNFNADRGRAFYPGVYNPAASAAPTCWSADGKAPDPSVKEKQSPLCQGCPQSVKGSKVMEGREMVACSSHRMIAVAPAFDLQSDPLRLKIAVTSDYDKDVVEHGWFAFRQYTDWLKSRGVSHTGLVVTKIKFDPNPAYPKLLFALDRVLTADEVQQIKTALANPKVSELLSEKWTAAGSNGTATDEGDIKPSGLEGAYADGWTAHPDAPGYSYKGQEVSANDVLASRYPAPPPAAKPEPTVPASQQVVDVKPAAPAPEPVVAPPAVTNAHDPLAAAQADGWVIHPDNAAYYFKGSEVVDVPTLLAKYPATVVEEKAAPVAPAAPPPAPVTPADPVETALKQGWVQHPDAPDYLYKGSEVVAKTDIASQIVPDAVGNGGAPAVTAGAGDQGSAGAPASTSTTAPTSASPSDGSTIPADVQGLLDKWTS